MGFVHASTFIKSDKKSFVVVVLHQYLGRCVEEVYHSCANWRLYVLMSDDDKWV